MTKRRLTKIKRYFFVFLFVVLLFSVLIDENMKFKLDKSIYTIRDFLELNIGQIDESVPDFNIHELRNDTNHLCMIPLINYQDSMALRFLKSDSHTLSSMFKACEPDNYQDSNKIENYLVIIPDETEIYKIKLNTSLIETDFKINKKHLKCILQRFDKTINQSEELEQVSMILPIFEFDYNFELTVNQTGFYYLECNKLNLLSSNLFRHVYIVYPYRMSKLIEQHTLQRKNVEEFNLNFNDSKSKLMLNDYYAKECETSNLTEKKMNVLMIGIDSMSSSHFKRVFPLTYEYLNSKSLIFDHVNSVGSNTYPNVLSLLSGIVEENLNELELPGEISYYRNLDSTYHDHLPFIWKEYEKLGFVTMYQEDDPSISIFNYLKKGFRYWPTTLYGRGYWLKYYSQRSGPDKCHYKQPTYLTWLNKINEFVHKMNSNKMNSETGFFSFNFLTEYTHNYFAIPQRFDQNLKEMLSRLDTSGYLDNTMLIVMGDHGNRLKYFAYATEMGKLERWLPFFSIRFPETLKNTIYLQNALNNRKKLVSFFDIYQTLRHYLYFNRFGLNQSDSCQKQFNLNSITKRTSRGLSLFTEIPMNRSCIEAFIPSSVCSCLQEKEIKESEFIEYTGESFLSTSLRLVEHINNLTSSNRYRCAAFKLNQLVSFKKIIVNKIKLFKLVVVLEPGDAWFESKIRMNHNKIEIHGRPSRLSPYGDQSICIKDSLLVDYCFCYKIKY